MAEKIANIRCFCYDWKDRIKGSDLAKAIKEVEKCGHGSKVIDSAVDTGNDSIITLVVPEFYDLDRLSEDVGDIFGYTDQCCVTKGGKRLDGFDSLWFKFDAQCGMPATPWLNAEDSIRWVEGITASDELTNKYSTEEEKVECKKVKAKALDMLKERISKK